MIPLFIAATILAVVFIFFLIAALIRLKEIKIKKEHNALKALIEERERTMYGISIEIHNNVNQVLSLARMTLKMIDKFAVPRQKKYIEETTKMLDSAIEDLRNISHSLNSEHLKKRGLQESLEEGTKRLNFTGKIDCKFEVEGMPMSFNEETELILIRIAQEAIQNTLKHAGAQNLWISLNYQERHFQMTIKDDGKGFVVEPSITWDGMGLQSIYNQSRVIGSQIGIKSAPGAGTILTIAIQHPRYVERIDTILTK